MNVRTVTACVVSFNNDSGIGTAETSELVPHQAVRIRFRSTGMRKVFPIADGYAVGSERLPLTTPPYVNRRDPQRIIMVVRKTDRGWSADTWGFRPGPNWVHPFLSLRTFDQFPGGGFRHVDADGAEVASGTIGSISLTAELITVRLHDDRELSFELDNSRSGINRYGITVRLPGIAMLSFAFPVTGRITQ